MKLLRRPHSPENRISSIQTGRKKKWKKFSDVCSPSESTKFGKKKKRMYCFHKLHHQLPTTWWPKMKQEQKKMRFRFFSDCERRKVSLAGAGLSGFKLIFQFIFSLRGLVRSPHATTLKYFMLSDFILPFNREFHFSQQNQGYFATEKNCSFSMPHSLESFAHAFHATSGRSSTNNENQKMKCNKMEERWKLYAQSLRNDYIMTNSW